MVEKRIIFRGLLVLSLLILMASFLVWGSVPRPIVISPVNNTFYHENITLSAIFNESGVAYATNITNVTFSWLNASHNYLLHNSTIVNTTKNQTLFQNTTFNTKLLPDGTYTVIVNASNSSADNIPYSNRTLIANVTIDNTAPYVKFDSPKNYSNVSGYVAINASVVDNTTNATVSVVIFEFYNGTGIKINVTSTTNHSGNWSVYFDTTRLMDGNNTVRIYANDSANNVNSSVIWNMTVDNAPPRVTILRPTSGYNFSFGDSHILTAEKAQGFSNYTFNASVNDNLTAIFSVIFNITNGTSSINFTATNNSGIWSASVNTSQFAEGSHTLRVFANSSAGSFNNTETVTFVIDYTKPSIYIRTANYTNLSNPIIAFNVTDNVSSTLNCSIYLDWLWNATTEKVLNNTNTNITFSVASDGAYNYTINCTDPSNNTATSTSNAFTFKYNFTIDTKAPGIHKNDLISGLNFNSTSNNQTFNLTLVNDTFTGIFNITFAFDNASGTDFNISPNIAVGGLRYIGASYNLSYNVSSLAEGNHTITAYVRDYSGNLNFTTFNFSVDFTGPSVTVTCTSNPTVGDTVSCTCTASDTISGVKSYKFNDGTTSESTTAASSGTSSVCTAIDHANNTKTATGSWTVVAASTSGSGSGGSSGGVSSAVSGTFAQETWASINSGETATVSVENGVIGVTEVSFGVSEKVSGAWVKVAREESQPSSVSAFSGDVYKYVKVTSGLTLTADVLKDIVIKFKVEKSWINEKGLNPQDVAMFRHVDDKWTELPTTMKNSDATYTYYEATTPGFSYFLIGEKESTEAVPAAKETPAGEVPAAEAGAEVAAGETAAAVPAAKSSKTVWLVIGIALLVAAAVILLWKRKRR